MVYYSHKLVVALLLGTSVGAAVDERTLGVVGCECSAEAIRGCMYMKLNISCSKHVTSYHNVPWTACIVAMN